jgi:hypothetical protein
MKCNHEKVEFVRLVNGEEGREDVAAIGEFLCSSCNIRFHSFIAASPGTPPWEDPEPARPTKKAKKGKAS